jgi:hypothetical protein
LASNVYQIGQTVHRHYQITGVLARPPYGARYSAVVPGGQQVMLWVIGRPLVDGRPDEERLIDRLSRFYKVKHPNLPQLHDLFVENREIVAVQHLVTGHGIAGELVRRRDPFGFEETRVSLAHLCSAVSQCHQIGLVVGDLWPEGVCFSPYGTMLISICAGVQVNPAQMVKAMMSQRLQTYIAPELRLWRRADVRADIWSLGAMAHLMIYGHPYGWTDGIKRGLFAKVGRWLRYGSRRVRPEARHEAVDEVLLRALSPNVDRRPRDPESFYGQIAQALHEAEAAAARAVPPAPDPRVFAAGHAPADRATHVPPPVVETPVMTARTQAMVVTPEVANQPTISPTPSPLAEPAPLAADPAPVAADPAPVATPFDEPDPTVREPIPTAAAPVVAAAPEPVVAAAPESAPRPTMSIDVDLTDFNKTRQLDANEINRLLEEEKAAEEKKDNTTKQLDAAEIERLSNRTRDS